MLEYKFTKGDRVVVLPTAQNCFAPAGATGTFNEYDSIHAWFYIDDEYVVSDTKSVCIEEYDIELIEQPNKTAEEIAPTLWNSYCNVLNEEALAALRQVIEDVENHEKIDFEDCDDIFEAFTWASTSQGWEFWGADGNYDKTSVATQQEPQSNEEDIVVDATPKAIKSDGGSSDYYKISVKTSHGTVNVEVNDVIYAMVGGDFDLANVLKAARRMYLASKGCGKEGVDIAYDARKIAWFCKDFVQRFGDVDMSEK